MKTKPVIAACLFLLAAFVLFKPLQVSAQHEFNAPYRGANLNRIAFPIGGMGAGMYCLEGTGAISHVSLKHHMEVFHEPYTYAAVCVQGETPEQNVTRLLEGPLPDWKYFGKPGSGLGSGNNTYGLPRFRECAFENNFPFAKIALQDTALPLKASIVGWSPFTPPQADPSSLPIGALEYTLTNTSDKPVRCIFSFSTRNFVNGGGSIGPIDGGFVLYDRVGNQREKQGGFAVFVDGEPNVNVDHCWFRGGWWDPATIAWDNVEKGRLINNPPVESNAPGASLSLPLEIPAGASKTIRLLTCWYWPQSDIRAGQRDSQGADSAFASGKPSRGTAPSGQSSVSGFIGRGLINTYDPYGDGPWGTLVSPEYTLDAKYMHLLVGGGRTCGVNLVVDGKVVLSASGQETERLEWVSWNLEPYKNRKATIQVVDRDSNGWGHVLCDHIVLSDKPINDLKTGSGNEVVNDPKQLRVLADFEGDTYGDWKSVRIPVQELKIDKDSVASDPELTICSDEPVPETYIPWYATQFGSVTELAKFWSANYDDFRSRSELFSKAFFDSTLPPEVLEAVVANLTILKSPTVMRQHDGRLWCWEGCGDHGGSCHGSCTHVWNYAQALCHLFPEMERSLRQTEYFESSSAGTGRQAFRANLPITPGGNAFDASDGQLGGVMKIYREWRIFGNNEWLKLYWPRVRRSLDYMIESWDPRHTGLLEESHHNTYDINYFGPDGHCGSFYLGALAAAVEMGEFLNDDVSFYKELLAKGQKRMVGELFNGEYFIQEVWKDGLTHNFGPVSLNSQPQAYRWITEIVNEQGPKYQYGTGCLSDGILGCWIALCSGVQTDVLPPELVEKHLLAIYKYNLRRDLSGHANPQRPTFGQGDDGGLLLCSWPFGGKPMLPFVYSDEVWTGIEYQVAAHLMSIGRVQEGLDIVQLVRIRYDGVRRNPFNEYECGHWYARAMSSYGMLQGLTGMRYDAVTKTLYVDSKVGDFKSFLCTATGFGVVTFANGNVNVDVRSGKIDVQNFVVK